MLRDAGCFYRVTEFRGWATWFGASVFTDCRIEIAVFVFGPVACSSDGRVILLGPCEALQVKCKEVSLQEN